MDNIFTPEQWAEIYYAVLDKLDSPEVHGDKHWSDDLKDILELLGPDGVRMYEEEIAKLTPAL